MKPRVVLDTNIYISAILFGGKPGDVFLLAKEKEIELFSSVPIISEIAMILGGKFHWQAERVTVVVKEIGDIATVITPVKKLMIVKSHESDNRLLECAEKADADFIVSGDQKHLLSLRRFGNIKIVSAAQFLKFFKKP